MFVAVIVFATNWSPSDNVIKDEIEEESPQSADIFNKLKVRMDQVSIRPLTEGKLE